VPGALGDSAGLARNLAGTEKFDALIALGAVIRGETTISKSVSNESAAG